MEAGFNIYPQLAWYDVSTADAGITVIAGLEDALDSRSIHIQEFGAIGFKKVLYEKGKGCLTWPGGCYPTIAKSVPRETICYSQLSFDYLFAPHAGGCPDLAGRIPDAIAAGQLPPHDLHLSTEPDGEPKRLLIAPSDVVSQVGCRVQTIAVVEGLGVPRRGVVVYAPWEGPTDELKASWKGIDLPIQCEDGCIICSIPALEANECGQLVLSAPA
jgi:hypothetical protein